MRQVADSRLGPPGLPVVIASIGFMGISFIAWAGVVLLEGLGGYSAFREGDVLAWLVPLLALPGPVVGSLAAWSTKRWWPFFVGLIATLLPALLAIVLASPPESFGE
jgi:hypothetical protein